MKDRKLYLWLIPVVLILGLALGLVLTFQPVLAGSTQPELNSMGEAGLQGIAVPQAELDPACTLDTTDAISHWPLDEDSDTTFYDALAGNHDGTCSGDSCPTPISGTNAGGQFFIDTDSDAITVPTTTDFDFVLAGDFSVGIWVKTTQNCSGNKVFIGRYGTANVEGRWWLGCIPDGGTPGKGVAQFHMRDSNYNGAIVKGSTKINDGKWHYIVGVRDGTANTNKLYVDGSLETTVDLPEFDGNFTSTKPLTMGEYNSKYNVNGTLDEAAVFDVALTGSFIDDYYTTSCNFQGLDVRDVTFDTSKNVAFEISAAELLDGSSGAGALSIAEVDGRSEIQIRFAGSENISGTTPAGPFTYTPPTDYVGTDFFTFIVDDGVNTARGTAIITMEAPVVQPVDNQTDYEGAAVSLQIVATDPYGDALSYEATSLPSGLTIDANTGLISGNVAAGASSGSVYDPVTVTVTDDKGYATPVDFTWTINPNNIPEVTPIDDQSNAEGETITPLQVVASDGDVADTLTYGATNLPTGLTIDSNTGEISGTVSVGAAATSPYSVIVTVSDGKAAPVEAPFTWTISGENRPPVVVNPGTQDDIEGASVSLQIQASDPDSDSLTYSATGLPPGLTINPTLGLISGTITAGASTFSPYTVKVRATDPGLLFDEEQFSWTVKVPVFLPLIYKVHP